MSILFAVSAVAFILWVLRNVLFLVFLWQLKEYRFDRVFIHLAETAQGKNLLFHPLLLTKIAIIFGYGYVVFHPEYSEMYAVLVTVILVFQAGLALKEAYFRLTRRPVFTFKASFIIVSTLGTVFLLFAVPLLDRLLWLLLIDRLVPFIIAFLIFFLSIPTNLYRDWIVERARKKMKDLGHVTVIAVTGSYGKTSTKEYIAQVLAEKFTVVKTRGTNNTPIGIANTILREVNSKTDIFVVEMGAYKRGEIAEMCQLVTPHMSVLTAVNAQHISLFGSIENTKKSKYEIIQALSAKGIGLFNGNNPYARELYAQTRKAKVLYKTVKDTSEERDLLADHKKLYGFHIRPKEEEVSFYVAVMDKILSLKAPLLGVHAVENILPAVYIAKHMGMSDAQIKYAVSHLEPLPKTMSYRLLPSGGVVIDDTFNANPQAVLAAIEYMKLYKGKKILVLQPMIELGYKANAEHTRIGQEIGTVCDYLFLTNRNFYKEIRKGAKKGRNCEVAVLPPNEIAAFVLRNTAKRDIAVFEGKEAQACLEKIL